ncbi:neurofibromin isoform X1, partial [Tachysurus ichikawai]
AFWNWVENYPEELSMLYQRPQTDMADCAEKLFDLVDSFAESVKRKAAVWPLQVLLLILCPNIIQELSQELLEESKVNKAFWNWVENYPEELSMLYQRPQTDMADCAEKLFDLVDSFAESVKRKAAVWPLQVLLLILCPNIIQELSQELLEESKVNK